MKPKIMDGLSDNPALWPQMADSDPSLPRNTEKSRVRAYGGQRLEWGDELLELDPPPPAVGPIFQARDTSTCLGGVGDAGPLPLTGPDNGHHPPQPILGPQAAHRHNAIILAELQAHIRRKQTNEETQNVKVAKSRQNEGNVL